MNKKIINFYNSIKKNKSIERRQNGYALLFAVVITSIISVIIAGLSNLTYKQLILTSLVKDSQQAFYTADTAIECALYGHFMQGDDYKDNTWQCGSSSYSDADSFVLEVNQPEPDDDYSLILPSNRKKDTTPCYDFNVIKSSEKVQIKARGYNMCNPNLLRTVQREIEVYYSLTTP